MKDLEAKSSARGFLKKIMEDVGMTIFSRKLRLIQTRWEEVI